MKKLLKNKKGSPLVEEGLLLGIAAVAFSIVLSIIAGILIGIKENLVGISEGVGGAFTDFLNRLYKLFEDIARAIGIT